MSSPSSTASTASTVTVESFASQCNGQLVPINNYISYFLASPLQEDELREMLYDPLAAVPPAAARALSKLRLVLVPYLEKGAIRSAAKRASGAAPAKGRGRITHRVAYERPLPSRFLYWASTELDGQIFLFLSIKDVPLADYHYSLFGALSRFLTNRIHGAALTRYSELVREELRGQVRGELDEPSWRLKEQLLRRQADPARRTKLFENYLFQSLEDTMTLYLHGLCCDIDVEAGPRQLPSRYIRRRLEALREILPPPRGFALFPEELQDPPRE